MHSFGALQRATPSQFRPLFCLVSCSFVLLAPLSVDRSASTMSAPAASSGADKEVKDYSNLPAIRIASQCTQHARRQTEAGPLSAASRPLMLTAMP